MLNKKIAKKTEVAPSTKITRIQNCLPSRNTENDWPLEVAQEAGLVGEVPVLPASVDLRTDWWKIGDRKARTGSCVGWAAADGEALAGVATSGDLPVLTGLLGDADADLRATAAWAVLRLDRRVPHRMGLADWIVIAGYMLGMLAIGWYYWRRSNTREDYLLGGRRMKSLPVGLSLLPRCSAPSPTWRGPAR